MTARPVSRALCLLKYQLRTVSHPNALRVFSARCDKSFSYHSARWIGGCHGSHVGDGQRCRHVWRDIASCLEQHHFVDYIPSVKPDRGHSPSWCCAHDCVGYLTIENVALVDLWLMDVGRSSLPCLLHVGAAFLHGIPRLFSEWSEGLA